MTLTKNETYALRALYELLRTAKRALKVNARQAWHDARFTPSPTHKDGNRHERRARVVILECQMRALKRADVQKLARRAAKDAKQAAATNE